MSLACSPLRRALVSVSDKTHLAGLADFLLRHRIEVLSTGGTHAALAALGVAAVKVGEFTGAPEILDGRVKTLHPRIHGGILARPTPAHEAEMARHGLSPIDLVVVNLYPFREVTSRPNCDFDEGVENIDIGGPAMVRAAAKNWERVAVVVDPEDYVLLAEAVEREGGVPAPLRRHLSRKAFAHTAAYDGAVADWLARFDDTGARLPSGELAGRISLILERVQPLRYGENPQQRAALYAEAHAGADPGGLSQAELLQGKELSYNNLLDADAALGLVRELAPLGTAVVVVKHGSPCGVALAGPETSLADTYQRARDADAESAFGGIVALGAVVDSTTATRLVETFLEVVIAPGFDAAAREVLAAKKNLRLLALPAAALAPASDAALRLRSVAGGVLVQSEDRATDTPETRRLVTERAPTTQEASDLAFAERVAMYVRSNAIVLARDGVTVGIGGGQTSRVEATRQAVERAGERARGAVLASDAFFPFRDGVDAAAAAGVTAIVQPGGSIRDEEVVAAATQHGVAMIFTGERHFRH